MAKRQTKKAAPKPTAAKGVRRKDATVNKMDSYEDTLEQGGEDQFSAQRDRILLEDTSNSIKRVGSDDEFGNDDEEVFAHKGIPQSDEDEEEEYYEDEAPSKPKKKERKPKPAPSTEPKGRFAKPARSASPSSSQEDSDADQDDDDEEAAEGSGSESEDETWGTNANAYYARPSTRRGRDDEEGSGDEDLEERREMEDREARKLQRKGREAMSGGDFGLEDVTKVGAYDELAEEVHRPAAPSAPLPTDPPSLLRHLERTAPETLALAREWGDIALRIPKLGEIIRLQQEEDPDHPSLGTTVLHYQTLLTYATTLAFYLHIAALPLDKRPVDLSAHPVLQRLVQLKAGLSGLENLDLGGDDETDDEMDEDDANFLGAMGQGKDWDEDAQKLWEDERRQNGPGLEDDELEELMADYLKGEGGVNDLDGDDSEEDDGELEEWELEQLEKAKKSAESGKASKKDKKKAKKAAATPSSSRPAKSIFPTLEEPTPTFSNPSASTSSSSSKKSRKATKPSTSSSVDDPHSESLTLNLADSSAKAAAKHSLRFHTSKIDSASARRSSARQGRMGGDEDIPYRNKQAARDAALRKNAPKGADGGGDDLDGEEWGDEDRKTARAVKGLDREEMDGEDMEGDDGYYQLVKKRKREEKEEKQDAYDEVRDAQRITDDVNDASGPRSLTRAIMKNRGLTPHRSKAVRNPRVKKRMRFDKAKKQVGSMQAVYKGGQGALKGNYGGEATGISTVVKSRKFV